jgi:hypothetical protein
MLNILTLRDEANLMKSDSDKLRTLYEFGKGGQPRTQEEERIARKREKVIVD